MKSVEMRGASKLNLRRMLPHVKNRFSACFSGEKWNNSIDWHVVPMEISMRWFLDSIKPASHEVTRCEVMGRHEALGQVVLNMRDYTRI
jgi:hypothetical protein